MGGETQRKLMFSAASLKMPSGKEAAYSFNLVGGTGRVFLIWALSHFKNWNEKLLTPFVDGNIKIVASLLKVFKAAL